MAALPVLVMLTSTPRPEPGEKARPSHTVASGTMEDRGLSQVIRYTETLRDEKDVTAEREMQLTLLPNRVEMDCRSGYGITAVLQQGLNSAGTYHTPYGDMDMPVETIFLDVRMEAKQGGFRAAYRLSGGIMDIDFKWKARVCLS